MDSVPTRSAVSSVPSREVNMRRLTVLFGAACVAVLISSAAHAQSYRYFCDATQAYYPDVQVCPVPWRAVIIPAAPTSMPSPAYGQGQTDRQAWETWFGPLTGDYRAGAEYWAGQRSLPNPGSCSAAPSSTGADWTAGCFAAQQRLAPSDVRRKTEPDYRLGWNNPPAIASSPEPENSGAVPSAPPSPIIAAQPLCKHESLAEISQHAQNIGEPMEKIEALAMAVERNGGCAANVRAALENFARMQAAARAGD